MKARRNLGASFWLSRREIAVPDANVRFKEHVESGSDEAGEEQASVAAVAGTMKAIGQLQPVLVRRVKDPSPRALRWELVFGHRRLLALEKAGIEDVYCTEWIGKDLIGVREAENLARKKMSAAEICAAVALMADKEKIGPVDIALRVGLTTSQAHLYLTVAKTVRKEILARWRKTPGAWKLADLARVGTMTPERQLDWLRGCAVEPRPERVQKERGPKMRARKKVEARREAVRQKKEHANRSPDFREGYVEALSWALGERT